MKKEINSAIKEHLYGLEKEISNEDELAEAITTAAVYLEKKVKELEEKVLKLEKRAKGVDLIESYDSDGPSSLVLRVDGLSGREEFNRIRAKLRALEKEIAAQLGVHVENETGPKAPAVEK